VSDTDQEITLRLPDNGGRRSGIERRRIQYTSHIPERRSGYDRRSGIDRRTLERRQGVDRRAAFASSTDLGRE
jgi:hypothetical protein